MVKIIRINGAFGAGKTSAAEALHKSDFQKHPAERYLRGWRRAFTEIFPHELPDACLLPVDTLTVRETADVIAKLL